jgi:molybdopterin converting factor subunit 1
LSHQVHVQYFAAARELAGCSEEQVELPSASIAVAELRAILALRHVRLSPLLDRMRLAINEELHAQPGLVHAGDNIAVLPPVAGGSGNVSHAVLDQPLSVDAVIAAVSHAGAGGITLFLGVVRDNAAQGAVAKLEYEAHATLANKELARVLNEIAAEWPEVRVCVHHRVGTLAVGELAVVVAASAPHRGEAFAACRAAIDRVKQSVPIWKKEWAPDGSALWVNLEGPV